MKSLEESDEVPPEEEVLQSYRENRFLLRCHRLRYEVIQLPSRISDPSKLASAIEEIVNECFPSLSSSEQEASPSHRVPLLAEALFSLFKSFSGQFLISSVARGYSLLSLLIGASKILVRCLFFLHIFNLTSLLLLFSFVSSLFQWKNLASYSCILKLSNNMKRCFHL